MVVNEVKYVEMKSKKSRRVKDPNAMSLPKMTTSGRAWLDLYLNPMGKEEPGLAGYPDGSPYRSVLGDYRGDEYVQFPSEQNHVSMNSGNTVPDAVWTDICNWKSPCYYFIALPFLENVGCVFIYPEPPSSMVVPVETQTSTQYFKNPWWTAYLPDGTICTSSSTSAAMLMTYVQLSSSGAHGKASASLRCIAKGMTIVFSAPSIEAKGFVTAVQFDVEGEVNYGYTSDGTVNSTPYLFSPGDLTPRNIAETLPDCYNNLASDGVYMPILSNGRDNPFKAFHERAIALTMKSTSLFKDHVFPGWNVGVAIFEGVPQNATFKLKLRMVVEYVPQPGSVLCNFSRPEADEDPLALEAAWRMRNRLAFAYPACYNDWGWLGDLVDAGISAIPGIGTAYSIAKPFVKPLAKKAFNWLGGKVSDYFGNPIHKDGDIWYDAR